MRCGPPSWESPSTEPSSRTDAGPRKRRRQAWYRGLTWLTLGAAGTFLLLSLVALGLAQPLAAGAAALCGLLFFIPGLFFLNQHRRLRLRDAALLHAAHVAEARGVIELQDLAEELRVPANDAEKILQTAIREGRARGELDAKGRFVAADAPRCPSCRVALPKERPPSVCPACGKPLAQPGG